MKIGTDRCGFEVRRGYRGGVVLIINRARGKRGRSSLHLTLWPAPWRRHEFKPDGPDHVLVTRWYHRDHPDRPFVPHQQDMRWISVTKREPLSRYGGEMPG